MHVLPVESPREEDDTIVLLHFGTVDLDKVIVGEHPLSTRMSDRRSISQVIQRILPIAVCEMQRNTVRDVIVCVSIMFACSNNCGFLLLCFFLNVVGI